MTGKLYEVRKRQGQWAVCSKESVVLHFESYDEALETVRGAVLALTKSSRDIHWPNGPDSNPYPVDRSGE